MVSDVVWVAAIAAVPGTIAATAAFMKIMRVENKVDEVSHRMDGRLDQVLELSKKVAFAAGVKQETDKISGDTAS
jgi:hypothetical protein